jgi:hypothetical protein
VEGYEDAPARLARRAAVAQSDGDAARDLAAMLGDDADVAEAVAAIRLEHAQALRREVERANRPAAAGEVDQRPLSDLASLGQRLAHAREQARELVPEATRFRAGLLGAVAAGCVGAQQLDPAVGEVPASELHAVRRDDLEEATIDALQQALAAEHAAVWVADLASAFLPGVRTDLPSRWTVNPLSSGATATSL